MQVDECGSTVQEVCQWPLMACGVLVGRFIDDDDDDDDGKLSLAEMACGIYN
jgi:hypothetical protein